MGGHLHSFIIPTQDYVHFESGLLIPLDSPWKVHLSDVGPEMTGITVSGLTPARTYQFRVCAVNQVGKGQYSTETSR